MRCDIDFNVSEEAAELFMQHHGSQIESFPSEGMPMPAIGDSFALGSDEGSPSFLVTNRTFRWSSKEHLVVKIFLGLQK